MPASRAKLWEHQATLAESSSISARTHIPDQCLSQEQLSRTVGKVTLKDRDNKRFYGAGTHLDDESRLLKHIKRASNLIEPLVPRV